MNKKLPWEMVDTSIESLKEYIYSTHPDIDDPVIPADISHIRDSLDDLAEVIYQETQFRDLRELNPRRMAEKIEKLCEEYDAFLSRYGWFIDDPEYLEDNFETLRRLHRESEQIANILPRKCASSDRPRNPELNKALEEIALRYKNLYVKDPTVPSISKNNRGSFYGGPFFRFARAALSGFDITDQTLASAIRYVVNKSWR